MAICIKCGKEDSTCLCDSCRKNVDIEELCLQLIEYHPATGENKLWDQISSSLNSAYNFKNVVFAISDELESPRKEYMRILCLAGDRNFVPKFSRVWLYDIYEQIQDNKKLSCDEINHIRSLVMAAYVMDYRYLDADEMAMLLTRYEKLPKCCYYTLGDFYTKTRRYEAAEEVLKEGFRIYQGDDLAKQKIEELLLDNHERQMAAESGKKEYMPAPMDAKQKYCDFLSTLGIDVALPRKSTPIAIPKDQYPEPVETREADFDSFVAFDLETTGFNTKIDSIIEIGAIKVMKGQIVEEKDFTFQELVEPFERKVSSQITELTGITQDDVKDARQMWEVTPDFMEFVGDLVLVGYDSMRFDSKFLARAGRYSNIIITNKHFDVMRYAQKFTDQLGLDGQHISLSDLSERLEIENPRAHRALADAITTARVFLKLKEMDLHEAVSVDEMLSDLDDW